MTIKETGSAVRRLTKTMLLLAAALLVGGILALAPQGEAKAADATEIEVNTDISGSLSTSNQNDYYTFTSPSDGYFYVTVSAVSNYAYLYIYDSTNAQRYYGHYSGGSNNTITSYTMPTSEGNSYTIRICNSNWSTNYTMKVNFTATDDWENDNDGSAENAIDLALDTTIHGNMWSSSDQDWYKVTLDERGTISISLKHDTVGQTGTWNFSILDEDGNSLYSKTQTSGFTSSELGYRKGTVLYLKVTSYGGSALNETYSLTCSFTKTKKYEMEGNDSQSKANSITVDKKYTAILNGSSDVDWYKFKMDEDGYMKLKFGPVDISNTGTWYVYLYDKNGNSVRLYNASTTKTIKKNYLKKGTYYLKVYNYSSAGWVPYTFKVTETAKTFSSTPVIKSVSTKYSYSYTKKYFKLTSITLSKKISLADGYAVTIANDKSLSEVVTSANYSADSKTITIGNEYQPKSSDDSTVTFYIQVRPYKTDAFGNKVYGKKSNIYKKTVAVK
ncbi:MAG: hypothetical protein LUI02_02670 [Clostridiales bacterium]|nr:hypothetical protein [Clostridiales bacterium]